jgi:hypothetical protein
MWALIYAEVVAVSSASSDGCDRATLVICPLVAVLQWRQEIERFTAPGTLKACPAEPEQGCKRFVTSTCVMGHLIEVHQSAAEMHLTLFWLESVRR